MVVGVVGVVVAVAFEAIAVATAMPVAARELDGLRVYGLAFSVFLTASLLGMVVAGDVSDRRGPVRPFAAAAVTFAAGLLLAGLATEMWVLVLARAVQGFGAGLNIVALYVDRRAGVPGGAAAAGLLGDLERVDPAVARRAADRRPAGRPRVLALGVPRRAAAARRRGAAGRPAPAGDGRPGGRGGRAAGAGPRGPAQPGAGGGRRGAGRGPPAVRRAAADRPRRAGRGADRRRAGAARGGRAAAAAPRVLPARPRACRPWWCCAG